MDPFYAALLIILLIKIVGKLWDMKTGKIRKKDDSDYYDCDEAHKRREDDIVTNPTYSFLSCNVFHKDRYDE